MRRVVLTIVSTITALVIVLSFKTHSATSIAAPTVAVSTTGTGSTSSSGTGSTSSSGTGSTSSSGTGSASTPSAAASSTSGSSSGSTTVTGDAADTRYGPVQVQVTVANGKVTSVQAVEYPENDPKDQQINAYAIPQLNQEATSVGSTQIDSVSGATYTSQGYLQSLQSALDKAGL